MNLSRYTNGLKRLTQTLVPIAEHYNKPKVVFWIDYFWSYVRYGITPNQYIGFQIYEKSGRERAEFYTHRQHKRFEAMLNDPKWYDTFWNKAKFNVAFKDFIHRDWLYCEIAVDEEVISFINKHTKVMIKPTSASSGQGVHVYKGESVEKLIEKKVLIEEFIVQHHLMSKLNPSSVNTIRVYTILDKANIPHFLSASIRVGGINSEVDNFHSGGVGYPLDVKYGIVMGPGRTIAGEECLYHPGTGAKMIGFEVPNWKELVKYICRATQVFPTARMIAWDVAVLEDGFEMVEGNYNGDPGFMQAPSGVGKRREIMKYI